MPVLLQIVFVDALLTVGFGFTVIVYVVAVPLQDTDPLVNVGVTVIVPDIGAVPLFVAVNDGIPVAFVPLAAKPIAVLLFVQLYVVVPPVRFVLNVTPVVAEFAHKVSLDIASTCADGFTVIVNVFVGPEQLTEPFVKVGVTTIVAVTGDVPALVAVKAGIVGVLVPLAARPIDGVSFVHE